MVRKSLRATRVLPLLAVCVPALAQSPPPAPAGAAPAGQEFRAGELYVTPKNGQTQDQQWTDQYTCHNWSKSQSGFDPSQPPAASSPSDAASKREQYRRAMTACLEAHGYGVRYATTPAAPPAPPPAPPPRLAPLRFERYSPPAPEFKYHPILAQIEGGPTVTSGAAGHALDNGWNVGLGLVFYPVSALPLGIRVDGSYSKFGETWQSLDAASQRTGTAVSFGHEELYGGDADLEFDLSMGPRVKEYFFGGIGWYRARTTFKQVSFQPGFGCYFDCFYGYFPIGSLVERNTTGWMNSWNAGMGFEFALEDPASFFIEARYLRLSPSSSGNEFIPIRFGLRF